MPTLSCNNLNLYYEIHGQGEPLLLIMGLGGQTNHWSLQIPLLKEYYKVIVFDNRGMGKSDIPTEKYTTQIMAEDTIALLNALKIEKTHILGYSLGSLIAQNIALFHSERVDKLILAATSANITSYATFILTFWKDLIEKNFPFEVQLQASLPFLFSPHFFENSRQACDLVHLSLKYNSPPSLFGFKRQLEAILQHDTNEQLKKITSETLILAGENDLITPPQEAQLVSEQIPKSTINILHPAGHAFYIESSDMFNAAVLSFLNSK